MLNARLKFSIVSLKCSSKCTIDCTISNAWFNEVVLILQQSVVYTVIKEFIDIDEKNIDITCRLLPIIVVSNRNWSDNWRTSARLIGKLSPTRRRNAVAPSCRSSFQCTSIYYVI